MEIDIRNYTDEEVTEIRFGDSPEDTVKLYSANSNVIKISAFDENSGSGEVYIKDIDNLILALQKAKELWS